MADEFSRTALLLGDEAMARLRRARVAVFGIGGVGSYAAEALARAGVGALDLIDNDTVSITNLNRQLFALHSTVGRPKVDAARERLADVAPGCTVRTHALFYLPETADMIDLSAYDYIIDAIDTVSGKLLLAERAAAAGVPLISAMGAGNKLDPTGFRVSDIADTAVCPLAKVMRKELKKRGVRRLKVVWSPEMPLTPAVGDEPLPEGTSRRQLPGSCAFVPPVVGLIAAGEVVRDLTGVRGLGPGL